MFLGLQTPVVTWYGYLFRASVSNVGWLQAGASTCSIFLISPFPTSQPALLEIVRRISRLGHNAAIAASRSRWTLPLHLLAALPLAEAGRRGERIVHLNAAR